MVRLIKEDLIEPCVPIYVSDFEVKNKFMPSYDMLKALQNEYPEKEFIFSIGSDLVPGLKDWDDSDKLLEEFEFLIITRMDYEFSLKDPNIQLPKSFRILRTVIDGSSTKVRNRIAKRIENKLNLAINGLTTSRVIKYITEHQLYSLNNEDIKAMNGKATANCDQDEHKTNGKIIHYDNK